MIWPIALFSSCHFEFIKILVLEIIKTNETVSLKAFIRMILDSLHTKFLS
jgi:hypothetical protein